MNDDKNNILNIYIYLTNKYIKYCNTLISEMNVHIYTDTKDNLNIFTYLQYMHEDTENNERCYH